MISQAEWVWYGYAGHLIVGKRCAYHLCTRIGKYLISTVGHYLPKQNDKIETIGAGDKSFFETFVFNCDGEEESGDPKILSYEQMDSERYEKSIEAERGHRAFCLKYAEMQ
jgi:hypothetical protein